MKPSRFAANRQANYANRNKPVVMGLDLGDFNAMLSEMGDEIEDAVRPAAQAGAEVLYRAVLRNIDGLSGTGNLKAAIYQAYSKRESGPLKATYFVSWRTSDAGLNATGQPVRTGLPTTRHAHLVEYGYIQKYAVHLAPDGNWYTVVKPKYQGKTPPWELAGRRTPRPAEAAEWYQPRKGGPVQVPGKFFMRNAMSQSAAAEAAVRAKFFEVLGVDAGVRA